ncbi:hypothetical protein DOC35_19365 [Salmonella enterica subsp. enterica]|nr:hypothetical protein [Salmonella enterica subsp. enterica]
MKRILLAALMAAVMAPAANAETLPAIGEVLATKTPNKYEYLGKDCERLYADYMRVLKNNHIAANAQAGCYLAMMDSLQGKSLEYREAKARWSERENMSATDAGEDFAALMIGQFDLVYMEAWERVQTELRHSK